MNNLIQISNRINEVYGLNSKNVNFSFSKNMHNNLLKFLNK